MASSNDLKNGMVLKIEGQLWAVIEFQHVKPGKGPAFVRTKLRSVISGKVVDKTFNAGAKIETANVDRRDMQYLYNDGSGYVFMDASDFDQLSVPAEVVGDVANFLLENQNSHKHKQLPVLHKRHIRQVPHLYNHPHNQLLEFHSQCLYKYQLLTQEDYTLHKLSIDCYHSHTFVPETERYQLLIN